MLLHNIPKERSIILTEDQMKALAAFYSDRKDMFQIVIKVRNNRPSFWLRYTDDSREIDFHESNIRDWAREFDNVGCDPFDWSMVKVEYVST